MVKGAAPITGEDIQRMRLALGETFQAFADRVGVHRTTIMRWEERGVSQRPAAQMLARQLLAEIKQRKTA